MPYSFTGQTLFAGERLPPALQGYLDWANQRSGYGFGRFNGILLNWWARGTVCARVYAAASGCARGESSRG